MKCYDVRKRLSHYIDGMLEDKMRDIIEEHLASCKDCSEELEGLRIAIEGLKGLHEVEVPEDFLERVRERIEQESAVKRFARKLFYPLERKIPLELAAAVSMVVIVIFLFQVMLPLKKEQPVEYAKPIVEHIEPLEPPTKISEPVEELQIEELQIEELKKSEEITLDKEPEVTAAPLKELPEAEGPPIFTEVPKEREGESRFRDTAISHDVSEKGGEIAEIVEPESSLEVDQTGEVVPLRVEPERIVSKPIDAEVQPAKIDVVLFIAQEGKITEVQEPAVQVRAKRLKEDELSETREEFFADKATSTQDQVVHSAYTQVLEFVRAAGGRVTSSEKDEATELPLSVSVEIPFSGFKQFLIDLNKLGSYETSEPYASVSYAEMIQLTIIFSQSH